MAGLRDYILPRLRGFPIIEAMFLNHVPGQTQRPVPLSMSYIYRTAVSPWCRLVFQPA